MFLKIVLTFHNSAKSLLKPAPWRTELWIILCRWRGSFRLQFYVTKSHCRSAVSRLAPGDPAGSAKESAVHGGGWGRPGGSKTRGFFVLPSSPVI